MDHATITLERPDLDALGDDIVVFEIVDHCEIRYRDGTPPRECMPGTTVTVTNASGAGRRTVEEFDESPYAVRLV